ncbi:hypothetical protein ABPG74_013191 [Tetrahymena malaccensis]
MYQNQVNNLNRITAYYGYPSNNKNSNTKNFDDSNNASLYSVRKTGDDTLNKSQSSPKSPNTSEILIQNIGGKVGDLSKEVSRLMQINDKLIADISALNSQNHNKDFLIKSLQERLNIADTSNSRFVQNANQQLIVDQNQHQFNNNSKAQEKEDAFQQQITNVNTMQPRSGISPNLYVNNMLNPNQTKNVTNFDGKEDNQRYLQSSLQVNTDVAENTNNFLFNSGFSQSGKNSAKHALQFQQNSYEQINKYNSNQINNITSPWSLYQQDEKVNQIQMNAPSFSNNNANNNNSNNQPFNDQQVIRNSQQNKMLMLASFQDKQSASSEQANNLQSQFSLFQEELENVKREKAQLEMNYNDLKQKYEDQQKEHAREIAQLKTNMFNSVVESDNYSKYDEDPLFNIENIKKTLDKNTSELVKSIEVDEKIIEGRFNKKDNANIFNNNSFSASKEQFMQKSSASNKIQGVSDHQTNLVVSQEIPSNKNLDKMGHSQHNIVVSSEFEKNDIKSNQEQFIKRNSLKHGTLNGVNLHKDNMHFIDILDQLEQAKKENTNLKYELKLVKEELLFISAKDTQAHSKNEQLRIIAAKLKLEQEEEIMKFRIQNEELQSELKKLNSLNKNLQNEILKLKEGLQSHQRSSTIMDEKTLENLFDSEIESEGEDLEDDGYGDRDSKQIRKHKNDILNTMTNNEKIYNKIVYLKRKNRRLEDQLEEWKRQYWLLEKSTQNNNYQSQNNNKNNNNNNNKKLNNNNNQNLPPQLIQQNSQGSSQEKSTLFEFNFSQFLQYQQRASQESKKQAQAQQVQLPQEINEINENAENLQKENKLDSSNFSKNEAISQCDTPAIGISVNQGKAEQITPQMNYCTPSNEITNNSKINKNNFNDYTNISNLIMNQQQNKTQQDKLASQQQPKQNEFNNISPKSANMNNNQNNFSNEQFYKQTSFSNYKPYSLNSNYQIQKFDHYLYKPVTQFSPSQKTSDQIPNQDDQINKQIHQIKEEKKQLEKGVISTIKDIRDQVNQLQKRKSKNAPQSQSHQQQVINQITKHNNKLQVQQQPQMSSQKIFNDQQSKLLNSDQQKQYQSTPGLIHLEQRTNNSTTKISHLINNFKKLNLEQSQSPITPDQKTNNLNYTSINSNNTSQNIGNFTCQTDRQILYNNSSQNNVQSQPSLNHINQYQLTTQQKNLNKIAQTAATTPKMSNAKQSTSVHYASNNQQSQQYQQIKQVLHTQPNQTTHQEKNTFNNRQSANLSYETTKQQLNNINKSTSPINSTKSYPKQIEQSYSNNFIYQKTKFNQRIKDKYN